jgi:hypothetical protein
MSEMTRVLSLDILAGDVGCPQNGTSYRLLVPRQMRRDRINSDDSTVRETPTETDNENSLQDKRKQRVKTIVSRKQLDREVLRLSTRSLLHSSGSILAPESGS